MHIEISLKEFNRTLTVYHMKKKISKGSVKQHVQNLRWGDLLGMMKLCGAKCKFQSEN